MDSLRKILPPQTFQKLLRVWSLDPKAREQLWLLDMCAHTLLKTIDQAERHPLDQLADLARFEREALDPVAQSVHDYLAERWPGDPVGQLFAFVERNDYNSTPDYQERLEVFKQAGKYDLFLRISQRLAERRQRG
jgi:hypothetical protein